MKGNTKIIAMLNDLLADELTAINQYIVHAEMCEGWGYKKLKKAVTARAISEMKHAERLIERILFLEGMPIVSELRKISIGADVKQQLEKDLALEISALDNYNRAVKEAAEAGDNVTKQLMQEILDEEDADIDKIEEKLAQISQMGIQNFLALQAGD
jgi:bacterioferritin